LFLLSSQPCPAKVAVPCPAAFAPGKSRLVACFLYCLVKRCFGRSGLDLFRDSGRFGLYLLSETSGVADQFCFVGNLIWFSVNVYDLT
jgi:hypothetical protein